MSDGWRRWLSSTLSLAGLLLVAGLILALFGGATALRDARVDADGTGYVVTHWSRIALVAGLALACFAGAWAAGRRP
ncbi:MAG: hypothetical protein ACU0BS_13170 [Hasllibacter sp.]